MISKKRYYLTPSKGIIDSHDFYCPVWAAVKGVENWEDTGNLICKELNDGKDRLETRKKYRNQLETEIDFY